MAATGGGLSMVAGGLQFASGLLHGMGGAGFDNSISAAVTLGASATMGKLFTAPAVRGHLTVSQRAEVRSLQFQATTAGAAFDTLTSYFEELGPHEVPLPNGE